MNLSEAYRDHMVIQEVNEAVKGDSEMRVYFFGRKS